jgi:CHAD domain-containing protein
VAYKLKPDEVPSAGLKRIAREELTEAIEELRAGEVHETRKHLKKVRALLRLVRDELGALYPTENARLREVGQALSPVRDAEALIEAVDRVKDQYPALSTMRRELVRNQRKVEQQAHLEELTPKLASALQAAKRGVRSWSLNGGDTDALEPGLKGTFRKGRKALAQYRKTGDRVDLHEWRKRVKDHWYHVRLLQDVAGGGVKDYERSLKELEDSLGEYLNLSLLKERGASGKAATAIDSEQHKLRERALEIGGELYGEKPRQVVKRLL